MTIYNKLQQVQSSLKVPKNQFNKFGGYNYRTCEDIMEGVKPFLEKVGVALVVGDEIIEISGRFYVKATARFIDIQDGTEIVNTALAREPEVKKGMDESQLTGAASTYARKYALNGLFCLDDVKDADAPIESPKEKAEPTRATGENTADMRIGDMEPKYLSSLKSELNRTGVGRKGIVDTYKVKSLEELTFTQYQDAMNRLKSKPDKAKPKDTPPINEPEIPDSLEDPELPWNQPTPLEKADSKKKTKREQANEAYDTLMGDVKNGKFT